MSFKQNIIHKLNNKLEMFLLSRAPSIPPCPTSARARLRACVRASRPHNVCLSLSECRLQIWQHTLQVAQTHTHAEGAVPLAQYCLFVGTFFEAAYFSPQIDSLAQYCREKLAGLRLRFPDWLIGNNGKGKNIQAIGAVTVQRLDFHQSGKILIMAEFSPNNPFNSASMDNIEVTLTVFGPPVLPCGVHTLSVLFFRIKNNVLCCIALQNLNKNILGLVEGHFHKACSIVSYLAPFNVSYSCRLVCLFFNCLFNSQGMKNKKEKQVNMVNMFGNYETIVREEVVWHSVWPSSLSNSHVFPHGVCFCWCVE